MRERLGDNAEEVMKKLTDHGISRSLAKRPSCPRNRRETMPRE